MATSYGLVDDDGNAISGTADWSVSDVAVGRIELTFDRDVSNAVIVATQQTPYCDSLTGEAIQVGKDSRNNRVVCVYNARSRFSFILIDSDPR